MESDSINVNLFGNLSAECTLLFSDIFNLFPGSFQKIISRLENSYRIVTYTDSGFLATETNGRLRHTSIEGYADDLIDCLTENNLSNVTYIAHSVNAFLAFTAALRAPHLFDKIILVSAVPYLKDDIKTNCLFGFRDDKYDALFNDISELNMHSGKPDYQTNIPQFTNLLSLSFSKMNASKVQSLLDFLFATDCRNQLANLEVPVMILQASGDKISTSEAGYFMYRTIPDSQLVKIMAKGHLPQVTAPEEIIQAMELFMHSPVW